MYSKTLGWGVCDEEGSVLAQAHVDPFATKDTGVLQAIALCLEKIAGPVIFYSCSKFITAQWVQLRLQEEVPPGTPYGKWWSRIFSVLAQRNQSSTFDIIFNSQREVKHGFYAYNWTSAREACLKAITDAMPVTSVTLASWRFHIDLQRKWLCKLSTLLAEQRPIHVENVMQEDPPPDDAGNIDCFVQRFPKWDWLIPAEMYLWTLPSVPQRPASWEFGIQWWDLSISFWSSLRWRFHAEAHTSVAELAFIFWLRVRRMPPFTKQSDEATFGTLMDWIRLWVRKESPMKSVLPDEVQFIPRKGLRLNQFFGYGQFDGGRPYIPRSDLIAFSRFIDVLPNRGSKASDWLTGVSALP
eukprot:Skav204842  [mRNA]  locus=scaffold751:151187:152251:+ [translate_table: standard]